MCRFKRAKRFCQISSQHFLTRTLPKLATGMALNVLAYNMRRVMAIMGVRGVLKAMEA